MQDLAPQRYRQRLLVEGFYGVDLDEAGVSDFLLDLARASGPLASKSF